jgi:septum formation protein
MLSQHREKLVKLKILLASQSPRRQQIFRENLGITDFLCIPSNFEENLDKSQCESPSEYVSKTSYQKAIDIIERKVDLGVDPDVIISADTIVVLDGAILEKPKTKVEAQRMIMSLSGRQHDVITAVTIAFKSDSARYNLKSFAEITQVFR